MWSVYDWLAGNGRYHNLVHCMDGDYFWITVTVTLDVLVAAGYCLIAMHWWKNERHLPPIPAKRALGNMRNIFLFCGICGYLFIPVKLFWPAWRLYDIVMVALVYFTWRYAWGAKDLKVVYNELGRTHQLREDLEKSQAESKQKSFFLNAVSHDLRTPLNGLMLQASLAEVSLASNDRETVAGAVAQIKANARVTAELLDGFLEYARLQGGGEDVSPETVDAGAVTRDVVALAEAGAAQKGITLRSNVPAGLRVVTDRRKFERILANLVNNAVKFTERGGVRVESERTRDGLRIHVIDTGIGVPSEARGRLFDEFFQVQNPERNRGKGFGLGLSIARRLARQLGGDVTLESSPGHGSRFTIDLPGAKESPPVPAAPDRAASEALAVGT